jgi:hypothetical protein
VLSTDSLKISVVGCTELLNFEIVAASFEATAAADALPMN